MTVGLSAPGAGLALLARNISLLFLVLVSVNPMALVLLLVSGKFFLTLSLAIRITQIL
jgi:hypothetical protein